jgi:hypothetical protein
VVCILIEIVKIRRVAEGSVMSAEPPVTAGAAAPKRSGVEDVKENSRALRGGIAADLAANSDHFSDQDKHLLKFHGTYHRRTATPARRAAPTGWVSITCSWSAARSPAAA